MTQVNQNINEFIKAIVCVMEAALSMHANNFVHSDIRWDNIIYDPDTKVYLLIDFENVFLIEHTEDAKKKKIENRVEHAIRDAEYILRLFADLDRITNQEVRTKFSEYFDFIQALPSVKDRGKITRKQKSKIKGLFWNFYEKNCTY